MAALTQQAAFVRQAASDFEAFHSVSDLELPSCHRLHFLQMATEKLAKAIGLESTAAGFGRTHVAFSKTIRILRNTPRLASTLDMTAKEYSHFSSRGFGISRAIEELHPQVPTAGTVDGANVEYPWRLGGAWKAPCDHEFEVAEVLRSADGQRLLKLIGILLRDFDRWFA